MAAGRSVAINGLKGCILKHLHHKAVAWFPLEILKKGAAMPARAVVLNQNMVEILPRLVALRAQHCGQLWCGSSTYRRDAQRNTLKHMDVGELT